MGPAGPLSVLMLDAPSPFPAPGAIEAMGEGYHRKVLGRYLPVPRDTIRVWPEAGVPFDCGFTITTSCGRAAGRWGTAGLRGSVDVGSAGAADRCIAAQPETEADQRQPRGMPEPTPGFAFDGEQPPECPGTCCLKESILRNRPAEFHG